MKKSDQKNHYMKYQLKNDNEYEKIIIIKNMRKFQVEKNTSTINAENIIQKNEKHDENFKNQNIMLKKKDIIDISIHKTHEKKTARYDNLCYFVSKKLPVVFKKL